MEVGTLEYLQELPHGGSCSLEDVREEVQDNTGKLDSGFPVEG